MNLNYVPFEVITVISNLNLSYRPDVNYSNKTASNYEIIGESLTYFKYRPIYPPLKTKRGQYIGLLQALPYIRLRTSHHRVTWQLVSERLLSAQRVCTVFSFSPTHLCAAPDFCHWLAANSQTR